MKGTGQNSKKPQAIIEGTIREIKNPYLESKLPVHGLFRETALMVSLAAMTNVRRIYHYLKRKEMAISRLES